MFSFSEKPDPANDVDEPIFAELASDALVGGRVKQTATKQATNQKSKQKKPVIQKLYYLKQNVSQQGVAAKPKMPTGYTKEMLTRVKRHTPPSNINEIETYEAAMREYKRLNGLIVTAAPGNVLMPLPKANTRSIMIIAGQAGSGKSVFTNGYIKLYHKLHPKRKIWIISHLDKDESLDAGLSKLYKSDIVNRILLDEETVASYGDNAQSFNISEFSNSLVIADDYDSISDKLIRDFIEIILDQVMRIGRHENIDLVITAHLLYSSGGAKHSRTILAEANMFVLFPGRSTLKSLKHLCNNYLGLDNLTIRNMREWPDRYVAINKTPTYVVGQLHAEILS